MNSNPIQAPSDSGVPPSEGVLQTLLSEKDYVDKQISSKFDANLKILGTVFTVVVAALGWLFSKDRGLGPEQEGVILLTLVAISSIGSLMCAIFNGFAFGFIAYKTGFLGPLFKDHLKLDYNPFQATGYIGTTPARKPIVLGTIFLGVVQSLLSVAVYFGGSIILWFEDRTPWHALSWVAIPVSGALLVGSLASAYLTVTTMNALRVRFAPRNHW
jgi:hypothetical protein